MTTGGEDLHPDYSILQTEQRNLGGAMLSLNDGAA